MESKTVRLNKKTCERLQTYGRMGETYDKLVNLLLDKTDLEYEDYKEEIEKRAWAMIKKKEDL